MTRLTGPASGAWPVIRQPVASSQDEASAERWAEELVELPAPRDAAESKVIRAVAARARGLAERHDPLQPAARSRVQTRSGRWEQVGDAPSGWLGFDGGPDLPSL